MGKLIHLVKWERKDDSCHWYKLNFTKFFRSFPTAKWFTSKFRQALCWAAITLVLKGRCTETTS